ncbi:MAG: M48 family metallopeptidase [Lachnospiraceae bacterium]|nr:M48 family metallopeptidase [Lachnospiraceae bacterium]
MEYTLIRSSRRTIAIEVKPDATIVVRAPRRATVREIERIVAAKEGWINKHIEKMKQRKAQLEKSGVAPLSDEEIRELAKKAATYIPERVRYYAGIIGVSYGRITIRKQKTLWGSCSAKGNLNFNCLLMLKTSELIDYVVVHELCHRKHMNHSKAFWDEVGKVMPDYRERRKRLKSEGWPIGTMPGLN